MKKYLLLFITLVVVLFLLVYMFGIDKDITEGKNTLTQKSLQEPELKGEILKNSNVLSLPKRVATTDEVEVFNQKVFNSIRLGPESKVDEIYNLFKPPQKDNSKYFEDKIKAYFEDYEENFHQIENLAFYCINLKDKLYSLEMRLEDNSKIFEEELNEYFFNKALMVSEACKKYGTREDPFWMMVRLARKGNDEMRLFLLKYMYFAIRRGAINTKVHPEMYFALRNEAERYLQNFAAKGVIYATEFLYRQYALELDNKLLPTNKVLGYYYAYLADVQNSVSYGYWEKDLLQMYDRLSEKQKKIADRMTKNL